MREELNYARSEESDTVSDETYNEETHNKFEPTTPKFTGQFTYEALEYCATKGRSERETLRESSMTIEDRAKRGKHKIYES